MSKITDKILELLFDKIWGVAVMLISSPAISVFLATKTQLITEPLALWLTGLFSFGAMFWIINNINSYRFRKKR